MFWRNPLLSVLLSLHYTSCNFMGQYSSYSSSGTRFNKNSYKNSGASQQSNGFKQDQNSRQNSSSSDVYSSSINCGNNNSTLCHHQLYSNYNSNYDQYQYPLPQGINSINYTPAFGTIETRTPFSGQSYYNNYYGQWGNNGYGENYENPNTNALQHQPIYYYVDPLRSRVDNGHDHKSHHSESKGHDSSRHAHMESHGGKGHGHGHGHEASHHHKGQHGGWGWSHQQEYHHHHEKKKKGKKSILGKLIKKFKPKHKKEKLIWKEVPECDGYHNFIKDLEIISWGLGWAGFAKATIGLILHFLNQVYLTFSVIKVGLPERIAIFIELIAPDTVPETIKLVTEVIGLIDYVFNLFVSYPVGNKIVVIEFIAEILTIASLALATITIFDDVVKEKIWVIFGIDLEEAFEGYGCHNPFSKEKKIEQFFEKFKSSGWKR